MIVEQALLLGLPPGFYQLTVIDGAGCGYGYSYEVGKAVGDLEAWPAAAGVSPNPSASELKVSWSDFERWDLYYPDGRLALSVLRSAALFQEALHLDALPKGVFWYRFSDLHRERHLTGVLFLSP